MNVLQSDSYKTYLEVENVYDFSSQKLTIWFKLYKTVTHTAFSLCVIIYSSLDNLQIPYYYYTCIIHKKITIIIIPRVITIDHYLFLVLQTK